mgnify:CR=1 FL=1
MARFIVATPTSCAAHVSYAVPSQVSVKVTAPIMMMNEEEFINDQLTRKRKSPEESVLVTSFLGSSFVVFGIHRFID